HVAHSHQSLPVDPDGGAQLLLLPSERLPGGSDPRLHTGRIGFNINRQDCTGSNSHAISQRDGRFEMYTGAENYIRGLSWFMEELSHLVVKPLHQRKAAIFEPHIPKVLCQVHVHVEAGGA